MDAGQSPAAEPARLALALATGFSDQPMSGAELDGWLSALRPADPPDVHAAWLAAAVRRAPADRLGTVWGAAGAGDLEACIRALAGRTREAGAIELPSRLVPTLERPSSALATAIARLRIPVSTTASVVTRLLAPSADDQTAAARMLSVRAVPPLDEATIGVVPPNAWPALARSFAARGDVPPVGWVPIVGLIAHRCRIAPRLWCNAWRSVRDAAPVDPSLEPSLAAAAADADPPTGLPEATASSLRCENAAVMDRQAGLPTATLRCAGPGLEWMSRVAQAGVWGASHGGPRTRAVGLEAIRRAANGNVRVLAAVAQASGQLPAATALPLVRALAGERDPGVLAALLESLTLHVQQARTLEATERQALERAPFTLADGPSLEARVMAVRLARAVGDPDPGPPGSIRALQQALQPDAGVQPITVGAPAPASDVTLRLVTEAGEFEIRLRPRIAPRAVEQVVTAARAHRYDGLTIHRVVPGFVAQGLDPRGDGFGGTDQPAVTELSTEPFDRGAVGIPLAGLDTGGIQLFVVLADAPHLDGRYPWVGRVGRGMDVVDGLLPEDRVIRVEVIEGAD